MSSEIYAVAKFMTSAKFMTLTLSLTLIYDPNPNPNPIPCEILDVEILDACADSPIVVNFASGEFRTTPGAYCIELLTGENSGYFLPEFFPVLKSMAESC